VLGVNVTINTDDPSVSDTSLTDEYMVAMLGLGINLRDLRTCTRNSIHAAFLPPDTKRQLETAILSEFDARL
jgi:adenosine deaminase